MGIGSQSRCRLLCLTMSYENRGPVNEQRLIYENWLGSAQCPTTPRPTSAPIQVVGRKFVVDTYRGLCSDWRREWTRHVIVGVLCVPATIADRIKQFSSRLEMNLRSTIYMRFPIYRLAVWNFWTKLKVPKKVHWKKKSSLWNK